jgi:hypothetical protein
MPIRFGALFYYLIIFISQEVKTENNRKNGLYRIAMTVYSSLSLWFVLGTSSLYSASACCSWNLKSCPANEWCSRNADNCETSCGGFFIDPSSNDPSCGSRYGACSSSSECCSDMICGYFSDNNYYGCGIPGVDVAAVTTPSLTVAPVSSPTPPAPAPTPPTEAPTKAPIAAPVTKAPTNAPTVSPVTSPTPPPYTPPVASPSGNFCW